MELNLAIRNLKSLKRFAKGWLLNKLAALIKGPSAEAKRQKFSQLMLVVAELYYIPKFHASPMA
jgi:hypothetical protein